VTRSASIKASYRAKSLREHMDQVTHASHLSIVAVSYANRAHERRVS
jgi:hypothetical protein